MLPVAIIGGGPVGLVSSILLSMRKIPHRVFEQFPGTSIHPKACGLNQRTVEIFRRIGIESEVAKHRAPQNVVGRTGWFTNLGPHGREIYSRDAWGGGKYQEEYQRASPCQYSTLAQIRLEPILQRRALELNPSCIVYSSRVERVEEKQDRVLLTVQGKQGKSEQVEASYVLGADGGRGLAESLGMKWMGETDISDMVTAHFKADILSHHPNKNIFISWLINPKLRGSLGAGYLYHLGPYYPTREPIEEWVLAAPRHPADPEHFDRESMVERIRKTLEIPNLKVDLQSISHWMVNAKVADRYRSKGGRIFLVGDACHRVPPWGALGMNSGLQDADNLVWKLGLALRASEPRKFDALLDTYDEERRPIAERVAMNSLNNMRSHSRIMDRAVGITPDTTTEANLKAIEACFNPDHPEHDYRRAEIEKASDQLDNEFHAPGIEIGWFYPSADINNEGLQNRQGGQILPDGQYDVTNYHPSTIPGHHLPHAWLQKADKAVSTRDLIRPEKFVLITRKPGVWDAVHGELVDIEVIDGKDHWNDRDGAWADLCAVEDDGAVLVRPDGIVAWRAKKMASDHVERFPALLRRLLGHDSAKSKL